MAGLLALSKNVNVFAKLSGEKNLKIIEPSELKNRILEKVQNSKFKDSGFEYTCPRGPLRDRPSLAASCDAALIMCAIDRLPAANIRAEWANFITSFQEQSSGWYVDPASHWVEPHRAKAWLFGFALRTINALEAEHKFKLYFLEEWATKEKLVNWIHSGLFIMHLGIIWLKYICKFWPEIADDFTSTFFTTFENEKRWFGSKREDFLKVLNKSYSHLDSKEL